MANIDLTCPGAKGHSLTLTDKGQMGHHLIHLDGIDTMRTKSLLYRSKGSAVGEEKTFEYKIGA